jgi:hypothetical protein
MSVSRDPPQRKQMERRRQQTWDYCLAMVHSRAQRQVEQGVVVQMEPASRGGLVADLVRQGLRALSTMRPKQTHYQTPAFLRREAGVVVSHR